VGSLELHYALPESRVRVRSTITTTSDAVLGGTKRVPQSTVALEVGASSARKTLEASTGVLRNTGVSVKLTDEGLLQSSSLESSGEAGKILVGVVGAATTAAGALISPASLLGSLSRLALADMSTVLREEEIPAGQTPEQLEAAAFAKSNPEAADFRSRLKFLVSQVNEEMLEVSGRLLTEGDESDRRWELQNRFLYLQRLLNVLQARLDSLNELFKAWRATTIETRTEECERLISIGEILAAEAKISEGEDLCFCGKEPSQLIRSAWEDLGVAVTLEPAEATRASEPSSKRDQILVRVPRRVILNIYGKGKDGKPVLKQSTPHLIMDAACEVQTVKLRRSVWAKRSVSVGFSDLGALNSYAYQSDSAAAAIASTAGELPGTITDSLEKSLKIRQTLGSLDSNDVQQQLTKVKAEAELKQQELTKAGLAATAADFAALEKLKQQAAMIEQRKTIEPIVDPVATEVAQLKQQVELLKLRAELG